MGCITKKLRGYGLGAMMLQLPIVAVQKSKYFRGKTILNVCLFRSQSIQLDDNCLLIFDGYFIEYLLLVFDDSWSFCGKFTFSLFLPLTCTCTCIT